MADKTSQVPGRVLVLTQDFGGGTGRHLGMMVRRWHERGWAVRVICQGAVDPDMSRGVDVVEGPVPGLLRGFPFGQLRRLRQVVEQVREFRPTLVHAYFFWSFVYGRLLRGLHVIPALVENREDQGFNVVGWQYTLLRATAAIPDAVVCVSEAVANTARAKERLPDRVIRVIRNGVEHRSANSDRTSARLELGIGPSELVVGMVANLNRPVKGVQYFIEAMPLILEEVAGTRFVIIGDGYLRPELEAYTATQGVETSVVFAGYRPHAERYYPAFDISVLTSLSEGLSITLLESMQYGLPIVATRVGGNPELVEDGVTGLLVPPRDVPAFARAVIALLRDEASRAEMGRAGGRAVAERFDADAVAERYLTLFSTVTGDT